MPPDSFSSSSRKPRAPAKLRTLQLSLLILLISISAVAQKTADTSNDVVIIEMKLGAVLGGVRDGKLIKPADAVKTLTDSTEFSLFGPLLPHEGEFTVKMLPREEEICPDYYGVEPSEQVEKGVAFSGDAQWNAVPRKVGKIGVTSPVYRRVVRDFLRSKGIRSPTVVLNEAYRIDLDGDGTGEVVLRGTNYSNFGPSAKRGEYSFVMVRQIVRGRVRNILLTGDFVTKKDIEFGAPNRHEISSIVDIDGDGVMEVVLHGEYYEGAWVEAYRVSRGKAQVIASTGCGL